MQFLVLCFGGLSGSKAGRLSVKDWGGGGGGVQALHQNLCRESPLLLVTSGFPAMTPGLAYTAQGGASYTPPACSSLTLLWLMESNPQRICPYSMTRMGRGLNTPQNAGAENSLPLSLAVWSRRGSGYVLPCPLMWADTTGCGPDFGYVLLLQMIQVKTSPAMPSCVGFS